MVNFSFATIDDIEDLMQFMHKVWNADHILSTNKELLLYEFQDGQRINIAIARTENSAAIVALFGFIPYNSRTIPDIAGSLWKVTNHIKEPMLGLKLRNYVIENIHHRFFAAPGAGLQTRPIYRMINMDWNRMEQYYRLNPTISEYHIALLPDAIEKELEGSALLPPGLYIKKVIAPEELKKFPFEKYEHILPFKDYDYLVKRFFNYPIYKYDVYALYRGDIIENLFVCRKESHKNVSVYRMVDFYGEEFLMPRVSDFLVNFIIENGLEYFDFISYGFTKSIMGKAKMKVVDFDSNEIVIPNYFEPFMRKNVPVYCVSDKTDMKFRQCKADGDQDRPSKCK